MPFFKIPLVKYSKSSCVLQLTFFPNWAQERTIYSRNSRFWETFVDGRNAFYRSGSCEIMMWSKNILIRTENYSKYFCVLDQRCSRKAKKSVDLVLCMFFSRKNLLVIFQPDLTDSCCEKLDTIKSSQKGQSFDFSCQSGTSLKHYRRNFERVLGTAKKSFEVCFNYVIKTVFKKLVYNEKFEKNLKPPNWRRRPVFSTSDL